MSAGVTASQGVSAVAMARALWDENIHDPPIGAQGPRWDHSRARIDELIRGSMGLHWNWLFPDPADHSKLISYPGDHAFEWCGSLPAWCWGHVGLSELVRRSFCSSNLRLDTLGRGLPWITEHGSVPNPGVGAYLRMDAKTTTHDPALIAFDPQPGDVLLVGEKNYGTHVTLVEDYDPIHGSFKTFEGNGIGMLPDGTHGQGVVRGQRFLGAVHPAYCARRLIRFSAATIA